ncbi:MAG: hypothetical protein RJA70_280 [Pseudomonadota bacterium]|jgi:hypothetical protein
MSSAGSATTRFSVPGHVVSEEVDGELVLLNLHTGIYFGLNQLGTFVWRSLQSHGDPDQAAVTVHARYPNVPVETIRKDVCDLVGELDSRGLLVRGEHA